MKYIYYLAAMFSGLASYYFLPDVVFNTIAGLVFLFLGLLFLEAGL